MTLYKTTVTPRSNFATPLRGDTLFGQLCWAIRYAYSQEKLEQLLQNYESEPYCIVSDGFALGFLPKPSLPSSLMNEDDDKKANRKKIWMSKEDLQEGNFTKAKEDKEVYQKKDTEGIFVHNSINYQTFNTGKGFDPYGLKEYALNPKDIYVLLDETKLSKDELHQAFELLSNMGYGQDSTIGKGRFEFSAFEQVTVQNSNTVMALSPFSPQELTCKDIFYAPFTRFGKKGGDRASQNPFKKPLLLADTGATIVFDKIQTKGYIGKAIKGHTSHEDIVHQGYSIVLPIKDIE